MTEVGCSHGTHKVAIQVYGGCAESGCEVKRRFDTMLYAALDRQYGKIVDTTAMEALEAEVRRLRKEGEENDEVLAAIGTALYKAHPEWFLDRAAEEEED